MSGAHLYGFASPDSDFDLGGAHVLPARDALGLQPPRETVEYLCADRGLDLDIMTHDVRKYFRLLLKPNGCVLEQIYSPLVLHTTAEHEELKEIARGTITRRHVLHYLGFSGNDWKLVLKQPQRRVKRLLYVFRVILAGVHLLRTGEVEANPVRLNEEHPLPYVPELIARKRAGSENLARADEELAPFAAEYLRLREELRQAGEASTLPEEATAGPALNDLLVRLRLQNL